MVVLDHGVLVTGAPGTGKTSFCIQLLQRGHLIIADDAVVLTQNSHHLHASAPQATIDKIADNNNRIYSISERFGEQALVSSHQLQFHLALDDSYQHSQLQPFLDQLHPIEWHASFASDPTLFEFAIKNEIECHLAK